MRRTVPILGPQRALFSIWPKKIAISLYLLENIIFIKRLYAFSFLIWQKPPHKASSTNMYTFSFPVTCPYELGILFP